MRKSKAKRLKEVEDVFKEQKRLKRKINRQRAKTLGEVRHAGRKKK